MRLAEQLKRVRRQGWIDRGVEQPETSADHSWAVALIAWLLSLDQSGLDSDRVILLALVHDLPEALAGDATPFDRHREPTGFIPSEFFKHAPVYDEAESERKHERERAALQEMTAGMPPDLTDWVLAAWNEYNDGNSPEARFVRQVDKLETLLQAELYRHEQPELVVDSFRSGADRDISHPALRRVLALIHELPAGDPSLERKRDDQQNDDQRHERPEPDRMD